MPEYDLLVKNGNVVFPNVGVQKVDIGIQERRIGAVADAIDPESAQQVIDAEGKYVFPGAIDSHFHVGIYRPCQDDSQIESTTAATCGLKTIIT